MSKEDWIILRLLMCALRSTSSLGDRHSIDISGGVKHLFNKYGKKEISRCIDQIAEEYRVSYSPKQTRQ